MQLAVFLAIGESWEDFIEKGQDSSFLENNLKKYSTAFRQVYVFSYGILAKKIQPNISIIPNKYRLHRFVYALLMPFIHYKTLRSVDLYRGMQITGGIPTVIAKLFFRKPVVINYGYDYVSMAYIEKKYGQALLYKLLKSVLLFFVDSIIITNNSFIKSFSQKLRQKLTYIPNSINVKIFKPLHLEKTIDILFVGRLEKQKNLYQLLDAISMLPSKFKVLFIGNGSQKKALIAYGSRLKIKLQIIERISNKDLPKYYGKSRIFVLPSLLEGHPKALLEAMSCQLPVIATDVEGNREVICNYCNGLLVPPAQIPLKNTLELLIGSHQLQKKIALAARKSIIKNYNSQTVWKKEIVLMKNIIRAHE